MWKHDTLRFRSTAAIVAATGALSLSTASCGGQSPACERNQSQTYFDPTATASRTTWHKAVVGSIATMPAGATGVVVGFENPHQADVHWNDSEQIPRSFFEQHDRTVILKIGNQPVKFSVYFDAPAGSAACTEQPDATFGPMQEFSTAQQQTPNYVLPVWPSS